MRTPWPALGRSATAKKEKKKNWKYYEEINFVEFLPVVSSDLYEEVHFYVLYLKVMKRNVYVWAKNTDWEVKLYYVGHYVSGEAR